jgi:SAM-dependent methyltransferase
MKFAQILEKIDALEEAHVLLAALELDIFTRLRKKWRTATELARRAGAQKEGMAALLNALAALKVLRQQGGRFANTNESYKHLCAFSPQCKKGLIWLRLGNRGEWEQLLSTIRKGRDLTPYRGGDDPAFRAMFTHAMHERSAVYAPGVAKAATRKRAGRLLDFGAGPGSYAAEILRRDPTATATLFDRPAALKTAKSLLRKTSLARRFDFLPGDLFTTPVKQKNFDTVLYANILHIYDEQRNARLLKKVRNLLVPGGRLLLVDFFLDDSRTRPLTAAMFALTMLLYTARGKVYTFKEAESILRSAGFGRIRRFALADDAWLIESVKI